MVIFKCPYCRTEYEMTTAPLSFKQHSYAKCQVCHQTMQVSCLHCTLSKKARMALGLTHQRHQLMSSERSEIPNLLPACFQIGLSNSLAANLRRLRSSHHVCL